MTVTMSMATILSPRGAEMGHRVIDLGHGGGMQGQGCRKRWVT